MIDKEDTVLFWDVDTQKDFMNPDGALFVEGAESIKPNLRKLTDFALTRNVPVLGSLDLHDEDDSELSDDPDFQETFPPHCIQDTEGVEKITETYPGMVNGVNLLSDIERRDKSDHIKNGFLLKNKFDVSSNPYFTKIKSLDMDHLVVYGVTLDVCVSFAVNSFLSILSDTQIHVVQDATQPIDPSSEDEIISEWENNGVNITDTDSVLSDFKAVDYKNIPSFS